MTLSVSWITKRLLTAAAVLLAGCFGGGPSRVLEPAEKQLGTDGPITMHYHSAVYYPEEIALRGGGYIVGIEKGDASQILRSEADLKFGQPNSEDKVVRSQQNAVHEGKIMFVSHIIRDQQPGSAERNCTLFDAYYRPMIVNAPVHGCAKKSPEIAAKDAYRSSWRAMDELRGALMADIASHSYTHIIVVVMGWNTVQDEAVRNINSIIRGLKHASEGSPGVFNPLVIGVTWPSQWNSPWLDPLYKLTSFGTKANDADEVGLTWLGVLLGSTLPLVNEQAKTKLPVIVLGHSFGARAATTAVCEGPVIADGSGARPSEQPVDLLINYQGAFFTDRLIGKSADGELQDNCPRGKRIALTSSNQDTAVKRALWGIYAGSGKSFLKYCSRPSELINCVKADATGKTTPSPPWNKKLTYVNADDLIKYNAFNTGGGAHSDIYRDEQGVLSWSLIKALSDKNDSFPVGSVQP